MRKPAEDWLSYAEIDYQTVTKLISDEFLTPSAAFHCHQCVEKLLKALLEYHNVKIPKTHDLFVLYELVSEFNKITIDQDILSMVNDVYIDSRYPGETGLLPDGKPTLKTINIFYAFATSLKDNIVPLIL